MWKFFLIVLALLVLLAGAGWAFYRWHPVFGGTPDAASLARIRRSKAFNGREFVNLEATPLMTGDRKPGLGWLWSMLRPPPGKHPAKPLPAVPLDSSQLRDGSVAWLGHSTVLLRSAGQTFITDPVFHRASPLPLGGKPFPMTHTASVAELPALDAVLISHDHYDHLDYRAIGALDAKAKRFIVPLGVKGHLQRWGVAAGKITELDWDESTAVGGVTVTLVPARHFSGRRFKRNQSLWGGYVLKAPDLAIYYGGDSGYGRHFAERIAPYGPFDLALLENGAYSDQWALVHETPEEGVRAALDLGAPLVLPIHWGKFDLSSHRWRDPIERFSRAAAAHHLPLATPRIGEVFHIDKPPREKWWEGVHSDGS